jgi:hypothetical protein
VHLGRIAFDIGDYSGWRRELEHARRLDPERFARLRHPLELFEPRLAGTTFTDDGHGGPDFDGTSSRATWRSMRPTGTVKGGTTPANESLDAGIDALLPGLDTGQDKDPERLARKARRDDAEAGDDCVTNEERRRFLSLGPIERTELDRCDLDELLRKLSG